MKKLRTTDEFLVKKKEPLVLPPDYEEIPEPGFKKKKKNEDEEKIKKYLKKHKKKKKSKKIKIIFS